MTLFAGFCADIADPGTADIAAEARAHLTPREQALPIGVIAYIGGDTPHVWTRKQVAAQETTSYLVPMWAAPQAGPVPGEAEGHAAGLEAAAAARAIGAPPGRALIAADLETREMPEWSLGFRDAVNSQGFWYSPYGSWGTVRRNYVGTVGYMAADWTGVIHIDQDCWYTQYASAAMLGQPYDIAAVARWDHIWNLQQPPGLPQAIAEVRDLTRRLAEAVTRL